MSDGPHRPGLWPAADGKWYPPDQHPDYVPPPPPPETWIQIASARGFASSAMKKVVLTVGLVLVVAIAVGIADGKHNRPAPNLIVEASGGTSTTTSPTTSVPDTAKPGHPTAALPRTLLVSPSAPKHRATPPRTSAHRTAPPSVATSHTSTPSETQPPPTHSPATTVTLDPTTTTSTTTTTTTPLGQTIEYFIGARECSGDPCNPGTPTADIMYQTSTGMQQALGQSLPFTTDVNVISGTPFDITADLNQGGAGYFYIYCGVSIDGAKPIDFETG